MRALDKKSVLRALVTIVAENQLPCGNDPRGEQSLGALDLLMPRQKVNRSQIVGPWVVW